MLMPRLMASGGRLEEEEAVRRRASLRSRYPKKVGRAGKVRVLIRGDEVVRT